MHIRRAHLALSLAIPALLPTYPALAQNPSPARTVSGRPAAPYTGTLDPKLLTGLRYRSIGPARGGRVTTVTGVPSQPFTFYMGSTGGGVWKTVDAGQTWVNVTDGQIGVGSMGAIDVSQSDPNTVYIGTGSDGLRSNVSIGDGVYKSTDAGKTWTHVGLRDVGQYRRPPRASVESRRRASSPPSATRSSLTPTGGCSARRMAGSRGRRCSSCPTAPAPWTSSSSRVTRTSCSPPCGAGSASHGRSFSGAREGGIYKSTDGGDTWTKVTNGLPNELVGKANIAVSNANPNRVYVLIEAKPGSGLYRSDDGGAVVPARQHVRPDHHSALLLHDHHGRPEERRRRLRRLRGLFPIERRREDVASHARAARRQP